MRTRLFGALGSLLGVALVAACVTVAPVSSGAPTAPVATPLVTFPVATAAPATAAPATAAPATAAPATAAPTPTAPPTDAPTPTAPPTDAPAPTAPPTNTPTDSPAPTPAATTLNYSLPAVYGTAALTSGFVPDPFSVAATAGGPVGASYLAGDCRGYTTSAPSFSITYTAGAFPMLRFYFVGDGDTTMIINSPVGTYSCGDDSFSTLSPTVDFSSPMSGRYDVWLGTYGQGLSSAGTLYVTESSGDHP